MSGTAYCMAGIWTENAVSPPIPSFLACLPCLTLIRGVLRPSLAKHMTRLEGNRASILAFYAKQDLENSIALLGAASKGDEEVRSWAKI